MPQSNMSTVVENELWSSAPTGSSIAHCADCAQMYDIYEFSMVNVFQIIKCDFGMVVDNNYVHWFVDLLLFYSENWFKCQYDECINEYIS